MPFRQVSVQVAAAPGGRHDGAACGSVLAYAGLSYALPPSEDACRPIPYRRADGPLNLLVDGTGIKFLGDSEWPAGRHGTPRRRQWPKVIWP